jgi:hypothetical protein
MSDTPSGFVDFSTYLGLNQSAAEEEARRLIEELGIDKKEKQLQSAQSIFGGEGRLNGQTGMKSAFGSTQNEAAYNGNLASFGEAMARLQDPGLRQAALRKSFGGGALDAALVGASGGLGDLEARKRAMETGDADMKTRMEKGFAQGQQERAQWDAAEKSDSERRAAAKASADAMAAKHAQEAEDRRIDQWALAGNSYFGDQYRPGQTVWKDPNAHAMLESPVGWLGGAPSSARDQESARDHARRQLYAYEKSTGKKWKATNYGGGW